MLPRLKLQVVAFIGLLSVVAFLSANAEQPQAKRVAIEWRFDEDANLRGWIVAGHIADAEVADGVLKGRAVDWDPILMGPVFEVAATPTQCVEIKIKATETTKAELFWTETLEGQHGGFSQDKYQSFSVIGDGEFHTYRIHPFWHAAGKIVRLRIDPPNEGRFEIASIGIVDNPGVARSDTQAWTFDKDPQGWHAWQDMSAPVVEAGALQVTGDGPAPILMSPLLNVPAAENPVVSVRMAVGEGSTGTVYCVSNERNGSETASFPLRADGRMHSYNVDVASLGGWRGRILMIGLRPSDSPDARVAVESIEIANEPRGPAELEFAYFGRTEGVNRTGRPVEVNCLVRNLGGEPARTVTATLGVSDGIKIVGEAKITIDPISLYLPKTASWKIQSSRPGPAQITARLEAPGVAPVTSTAAIEFTSPPDVPKMLQVPEPRPVKSDYEVGAFYFPGWHDMSRWNPILDFPERKPVLGWYDESNPECADWQIKWSVEHGIDFYMVDWYWSEGDRHLEHWLHDAYMKAKHRKYLKWCIMWANHNRPNTHSPEDWKKVTQYWIDNYFDMEEYYRIDGRPVVFIWAPANIRRDVGGTEEATKLYAMSQEMARAAGHKGIYFAAMSSHESEASCKQLRAEGYEAFTSYHGFQLAEQEARSTHFGFEEVVRTSPRVWESADERAGDLLYMPIVDSGWASQPWHRGKARIISGRTPELFGQLCQEAAEYCDATGKKIITVGPVNEWGEGSYIEPYAEYGFGDLAALRKAFCSPGDYPPNIIPTDVGLGPYDLPPIVRKAAWEFNTDGDHEGWTANSRMKTEVAGGLLIGETMGPDPILSGPAVQIEAYATNSLTVRMRVDSKDDHAQLFWSTTTVGQSEATSAGFELIGDGEFHEYTVDLSRVKTWRGVVVSLRLDPVAGPGAKYAIDYIRFE